MSDSWLVIWNVVQASPFFGIVLSIGAFFVGRWCYERSGRIGLFQPVVIGVVVVVGVLLATGIPYAVYYDGAQWLNIFLGPVIVALAVPLYLNLKHIKAQFWPIALTLIVSGTLVVVITVVVAWWCGASVETLLSIAPKSTTTPIAMLLAERMGGYASLAAISVLYTGLLGVVVGPAIMKKMNVKDESARGLALGLTAHAIGTARALEEGDECAAFSALAMGITGILTAFLLPFAVSFFL